MTIGADTWTDATIAAYLHAHPELHALIDPDTARIRDVSTGNLNSVFLIADATGREIFIKQAPGYVRVNPSRKLSPHRVLLEADALSYFGQLAHGQPVTLLATDADEHVIVLESLSDHVDWRAAMNSGLRHDGVTAQLAEFVALCWAGTHRMVLGEEEHLALIARFGNPELCRLTDTVVFTEPFDPAKPHRFRPEVTEPIEHLWADRAAMRAVAVARSRFLTERQALLHGDLHSGSVMVPADGSGAARIIDPEFATVGPIGFDLGLVLGSLLTQAARSHALGQTDHRAWIAAAGTELVDAFLSAGRAEAQRHRIPADVAEYELHRALDDAAAMGSCEALRRLIHAAPVADLEELTGQDYVAAGTWLVDASTRLLHEPSLLADSATVHALLEGENP